MFAETKLNLDKYKIRPSEGLGQHFLIDERVIEMFADGIINGAHVVEIGAGTGIITRAIAKRASDVMAVEIDERYQPILDYVESSCSNVSIRYGNILDIGLRILLENDAYNQVVANLPFHITEPFLWIMIGLPIEKATLLLGDNIARQISESENSRGFGRMSLLAQTFFEPRLIATVPRSSCYPQPRTDCALIELTFKNASEINADPSTYIFAKLFTSAHNYPLVKNVLKDAIGEASERSSRGTLGKRESHQIDRANTHRQSKQWIREFNSTGDISFSKPDIESGVNQLTSNIVERMGIDESILRSPFLKLDNQDIRSLVAGIKRIYK